jgi:hypothetical protein
MKPMLRELWIADPVGAWEALGFSVVEGVVALDGVRLHVGEEGRGITAWAVEGVELPTVDGLETWTGYAPREPSGAAGHPNGVTGLDHVVIVTPDFDRTAAALAAAGMTLRRIRDAGGFRQGFRRLGPAILELVEVPDMRPGAAAFWGLTMIVSDLDALAARLGDRLRPIKDAVQPGRRIATLDRSAGLSPGVAFMTPEPGQE